MLSDSKWGLCDLARSRGRRPRVRQRAERGASWGSEDERENEESFSPISLSPSLSVLSV